MDFRELYPDVPSEGDEADLVGIPDLSRASVHPETGEVQLHEGTIRRWISQGNFPAPRLIPSPSNKPLYHPNDVMEHLRQRADEQSPSNKRTHYPARGGRAHRLTTQADAIDSSIGVHSTEYHQAPESEMGPMEMLAMLEAMQESGWKPPAPPAPKTYKENKRTGQLRLF